MKFTEDLQKWLPLDYLFLAIVGVFKEGILYYQVGINNLKYSNIVGIFIFPIANIS